MRVQRWSARDTHLEATRDGFSVMHDDQPVKHSIEIVARSRRCQSGHLLYLFSCLAWYVCAAKASASRKGP